MVTFGIEEEYAFLDPVTLLPSDVSPAVYRALQVGRAESRHVQREFLLSQLERPSPVCETAADALADLEGFRSRLAAAAESVGVIAASSGTFPRYDKPGRVTDKPRYRRVVSEYGVLGGEHFLSGLHVHVAIPDREAGVRAMNALRSWMPVIAAIAANSPLWRGEDSGFSSWRTINLQRWATRGTPPQFADAADYERRIARVVGVGGTFDAALVAWNMRLSDNFPTIEVRAADAQLEAWQSVLVALVIRGLVVTALEDADAPAPLDAELIDSALWHSARDGLTGGLVHPFTGAVVPARQVLDDMLQHIAAAVEREGDTAQLREWLDRLLAEGTGAERQRAAFVEGGLPALGALFRGSLAPQ